MRTQSIKPFGTLFGSGAGLWSTLFQAAVQGRTLITAAGLLTLFLVLFAAIQFATPNLVDNDAYFH